MKYPLIVKKKLNNNQWLFDIYDDPQDHYDEASSLAIIKMVFGCWAWLLTEMLFVHIIYHLLFLRVVQVHSKLYNLQKFYKF